MKTNWKKTTAYFLVMLSFILLGSQVSISQNTKVEKILPPFNIIEITDNMTVSVSQGSQNMIILEGEEKTAHDFEPIIKDNTLKIKLDINTDELTSIHIVVTELKEIILKGASSLKSTDIIKAENLKIVAEDASSIKLDVEAENLHTLVEGAASIKYTGKASTHKIQIKGAASIKAYELETVNTEVDLAGAGTAQVNVKNELTGEISGLGSILYNNEPSNVNIKTSGLGTVKKAGDKTSSASADTDTTKFNIGQKEVQILSKNDDDKKKKKEKFDGHWGGIEIGVNNYLNRYYKMEVPGGYDFMDLKTSKSVGVSINFYEQNIKLYKEHFGLVTGLGLTYNNYKFINNTLLTPKVPLVQAVEDTTRDFIKNKLTVSYLTMPLILEVNTGKNNKFHIGAGAIMGIRLGAHTKQVYEINGTKNKDKTFDDFNLHPFKADATVRIGFGIVNLFANYSLLPLFKDGKQPELYPFTVGLRILGL